MPMDLSLYPDNWHDIAREVKDNAGWRCEECERDCFKPEEDTLTFIVRIGDRDQAGMSWAEDDLMSDIIDHPRRWQLTTSHVNHRPEDCRPENLRALCTACHCRYDLQPAQQAIRRRLKQERNGQLSLALG